MRRGSTPPPKARPSDRPPIRWAGYSSEVPRTSVPPEPVCRIDGAVAPVVLGRQVHAGGADRGVPQRVAHVAQIHAIGLREPAVWRSQWAEAARRRCACTAWLSPWASMCCAASSKTALTIPCTAARVSGAGDWGAASARPGARHHTGSSSGVVSCSRGRVGRFRLLRYRATSTISSLVAGTRGE